MLCGVGKNKAGEGALFSPRYADHNSRGIEEGGRQSHSIRPSFGAAPDSRNSEGESA